MKNRYEVLGDTTIIFATGQKREYAILVDTGDLEKILTYPYTWHLNVKGDCIYAKGFSGVRKGKTNYQLNFHRWLLDCKGEDVVDHINHNTLDNRRCNLRIITRSENQQNRKGEAQRGSVSGHRGVGWQEAKGKWRSRVCVNGKSYHLGYFDDIEEAKKVVRDARKRLMPYSIA